jgi:hypothetical protein
MSGRKYAFIGFERDSSVVSLSHSGRNLADPCPIPLSLIESPLASRRLSAPAELLHIRPESSTV